MLTKLTLAPLLLIALALLAAAAPASADRGERYRNYDRNYDRTVGDRAGRYAYDPYDRPAPRYHRPTARYDRYDRGYYADGYRPTYRARPTYRTYYRPYAVRPVYRPYYRPRPTYYDYGYDDCRPTYYYHRRPSFGIRFGFGY